MEPVKDSKFDFDTLILDAGPILKNSPPIDTLRTKSHTLCTVPSVLSEIKDHATRTRIETFLLPFLTLRAPRAESVRFVADFAKKSGDFSVLSKTDVEVLALTYEIECEKNGDQRLRKAPGQRLPNLKKRGAGEAKGSGDSKDEDDRASKEGGFVGRGEAKANTEQPGMNTASGRKDDLPDAEQLGTEKLRKEDDNEPPTELAGKLSLNEEQAAEIKEIQDPNTEPSVKDESDDSEGGWITPSNLKRHQQRNTGATVTDEDATRIQIACITTDFAMQNVLLQIGLSLLSPTFQRIRSLKTYILRCHACFQQVKDTSKQFCPRCGQPALTRVSCSTSAKGEFRVHLKKNMEWHHRGDRYSIPKPVSGQASGKKVGRGGGKGGWGRGLILAEDQKEYQRAWNSYDKQQNKRDAVVDEDRLPGILTGARDQGVGRPRVGAGRSVNSRKRA